MRKTQTASLLSNDKCIYPKAFHFSTEANNEDDSTSALKATVEDELDSALDDILGMAFEEAGDTAPKSNIKVQAVANSEDDEDVEDDEVR